MDRIFVLILTRNGEIAPPIDTAILGECLLSLLECHYNLALVQDIGNHWRLFNVGLVGRARAECQLIGPSR